MTASITTQALPPFADIAMATNQIIADLSVTKTDRGETLPTGRVRFEGLTFFATTTGLRRTFLPPALFCVEADRRIRTPRDLAQVIVDFEPNALRRKAGDMRMRNGRNAIARSAKIDALADLIEIRRSAR